MGIVFAVLSALSFAISSIFVKKGMGSDSSKGNQGYFITVFSNAVLLSLLFLLTYSIGDQQLRFNSTGLTFFVLSGLLTTGLGRITFYQGIHRIGPSRSTAIKNGSPIFVIIYALIVLGETITFGPLMGILLIILGILLLGIVLVRQSKENDRLNQSGERKWSIEITGYIFSIVSAMSFGIGQAIRKQGLAEINDAFFGAAVGAITSLIFVIIFMSIKGELKKTLRGSFFQFQSMFWLAGVFTSLGPLFFFLGITYTQVSYVGVIAATEPIMTIIISAIFLKKQEQLSKSIWITALLVLAGAIMISFWV